MVARDALTLNPPRLRACATLRDARRCAPDLREGEPVLLDSVVADAAGEIQKHVWFGMGEIALWHGRNRALHFVPAM